VWCAAYQALISFESVSQSKIQEIEPARTG
jgi:hypothetical protein